MSSTCTIYGCILGGGLFGSPSSLPLYHHNQQVIQNLPKYVSLEQNVLLSSSMFTAPMPDDEQLTLFFREQMIHFGLSANHFHSYWKDWLNQFENLLRNLYWGEAYVHLTDEIMLGHTQYYWYADVSVYHEKPPRPIEKWKFTGGPRHFVY